MKAKAILASGVALALCAGPVFAQVREASIDGGLDASGVSAVSPESLDAAAPWQSLLQDSPGILGRSFDSAQINALSRVLGSASVPPTLVNPAAKPAQNWKKVSAAVAKISSAAMTQARAAVRSGNLKGADARSLSRNLQDLSVLGQTISGVRPLTATRLRQSLKALILKQNAASKAAVARYRHPNFDGGGRLAPADFSGDSREIAQLRQPDEVAPERRRLEPSAPAAKASRHALSFRGPVARVPGNLTEPLDAAPAPAPAANYSGPKPMPAPRVVKSAMETVGDALVHAVTHSYPGKPGSDPIKAVADFVNQYAKDKSLPNSQKHLILKYYEMNDPRLYAAIEAAAKTGMRVTFIADLNQYLIGKFESKPHFTWDFESASYKDNEDGQFLRKLKALGFGYDLNRGKLTVLSGVPLFDPNMNRETALMHDKVAVALGRGGQAYPQAVVGTANLTQVETESKGQWPSYGGRYNRFFWAKDPAAIGVDWEHALAEEQAYNSRLGAKGLAKQDHSPVRVVYRDGSYQEIAFTDGIQNPNDRITDLLTRAADPKNGIEVDEIVFSHFVLTDTGEVQALRKLMAAQSALKIYGVFDQMFIPLNGYGLAGALANFLVQRPMGRPVYPFSAAVAPRMNLFGYQRLLDGTKQAPPRATEDDGDPTGIHLWHDKTTLVKTTETNPGTGKKVQYVYVFTRTLNDSNHYQNLESQVMIKMLASAPLAQEIENSVKLTVKSEPQYALDLSAAIARDFLGGYAGRSAYEVTPAHAQSFLDALRKADYKTVSSIMSGLVTAPDKVSASASAPKTLIARFVNFLEWYAQARRGNAGLNPMTYQKAISVGVALLKNDAMHVATALDVLYYNSRLTQEQMNALMSNAWTQGLKMSGKFPTRNPQAQTPAKK